MTTQTSMKELLKQHASTPDFRKISSVQFHESGAAEAAAKNFESFEYLTELRTGEMDAALPPTQAWLVEHHVDSARRSFISFRGQVYTAPHLSAADKCRIIRNYAKDIMSRLAPCFEGGALSNVWDTKGRLRKRFYAIHADFVKQLDEADSAIKQKPRSFFFPKDKGRDKRKFAAYSAVFAATYRSISDLLFDIGEAVQGE